MKILVTGLNHKSAPIAVREKLAFDAMTTLRALRMLKNSFPQAEFVLLSTCNRVELYTARKAATRPVAEDLIKFLSEFHNVQRKDFQDFLYVYTDEDAVRHLLTVASSLDSMVVGEVQIIRQVKESYKLACSARSTGKVLNRLFHCAFATSKKVHTTTSISTGRVSVAGVAIELAGQLFEDMSAAKVVVIGAGEMAELLLQHLLQIGCRNITLVNRSYERAMDVANRYGISAGKWGQLAVQLIDANIAIGSAAVQDYLFKKEAFGKIIGNHRKAALLIIDIAVPRNFEPSINDIQDVYLYSIDELFEVAERNRRAREGEIARGMQTIYENVAGFMDWFSARDIGPLIGQMKEKFGQLSQDELERFFVGARQDASCREVMETMVNRLVNRLLHCVIKNVNVIAKENGSAEAARIIESIVQEAEEVSSRHNKEDV